MCVSPEYAAGYGFRAPEGFRPVAVALNCGMYRIEPAGDPQIAMLMGEVLPNAAPEEYARFSPLGHVTGDFPPAFIMTSNNDFLKAQAPLLAARLMALNVPFALHFYGDRQTRLGHVFHCDMRSADAARCNDDECAWFRRFCGEA